MLELLKYAGGVVVALVLIAIIRPKEKWKGWVLVVPIRVVSGGA